MGEVCLQLAEPLMLLLRAFAFRHIDLRRDNLNKFPACGERRSADCLDVFDRSIGEYYSVRSRVASFRIAVAAPFRKRALGGKMINRQ